MKTPIRDYSLLSLLEWLWLQGETAPDAGEEEPGFVPAARR